VLPNNVQFISKKTGEPIGLNHLDEEIANALGVAVHPTEWCRDWFNLIGFWAVMGDSYSKIRAALLESETPEEPWLIPVLDHLEANYTLDAWASR
jgi:hypothetical protein